jgi:undecaprenyl diphosphate synthase
MDGNGRWAQKRGLPRTSGHIEGARVFKRIANYCYRIGIRYLTVYAFSTENWSRPQAEIRALFRLMEQYLDELDRDSSDSIRLRFIGDRSRLSQVLQTKIAEVEELTKNRTGLTVNIALNYGGRNEIVHAVKTVARQLASGEIQMEDITEEAVSNALFTAGQPDPDVIIRPSGENRLSNFLLWQAAYSEFVFMDVLWPDFTEQDLDRAIEIYQSRNRRFGGV